MTDGMLSLSWNNHKATFCHILSTLREKERYTDVTVACEGKFYPVHKFVLSTCSEYFEKMFEHTPCKHPVIVLKDVLPDELEALLSYMYDGVVSVAQNDLARLIKAAELLRIKGLAVPDEPPKPEPPTRRRTAHTRNATDDRTSPHPKRRKADDSSRQQQQATPPSSPRASPYHTENEQHQQQASSRLQQQEWMDHRDTHNSEHHQDDRNDSLNTTQSSPSSKVQVVVDETLVKEEMVDPIDNQDDGMDYGSLGSDSRLEGSVGGEGGDDSTSLMSSKYDPNASQGQALPEAVVEALAGPSGMQGWLGGVEVGGGFAGLEGYAAGGGEAGADGHQGGQQHQMVEPEASTQWSDGRTTREWPVLNASNNKVYCCRHCAFNTTDRATFKTHTLQHKGEKPFACSFCPYRASRKFLLKEHTKTHTGERPFTCPFCSYSASQRNSLKAHIRRHTGEKPFACTMCSYRATQRSTLKTHMLTHKMSEAV